MLLVFDTDSAILVVPNFALEDTEYERMMRKRQLSCRLEKKKARLMPVNSDSYAKLRCFKMKTFYLKNKKLPGIKK